VSVRQTGKLLGGRLPLTDSTGTTVATYGYEGLGNRTSLTRPNGAATAYVPDAAGRLQQLAQNVSGDVRLAI
jgi:YD repeat-containing protein